MKANRDVVGVILAGGLSRRMGGDKPLRMLGGRALMDRVIDCIGPQCEKLVINANGDPSRYAERKLPVAADSIAGFAGPLAGVLAGCDWAAEHAPRATHICSVAADCPFLPGDLVLRLCDALGRTGARLAVASSAGQTHHAIGLWEIGLREELRHALEVENVRKIDQWTGRYAVAEVAWSAGLIDPFFNANTPEDIERAERLLGEEED